MSYNPSVAKFKTDMLDLAERMSRNFHDRLVATAEEIAENMRAAAPKDSGALAASVRIRDITRKRGNLERTTILIIAGGPTTTKRGPTGVPFDHALAAEFGTVKQEPEPFFYNTWRRYQYLVNGEHMLETVEQTIKENERIRAGNGGRSEANFALNRGREGRQFTPK